MKNEEGTYKQGKFLSFRTKGGPGEGERPGD